MSEFMEYDEATRLYRRVMMGGDPLFHLSPPAPSPRLSHCNDEVWYLRDNDGKLIARVSRSGVRLA